MPHAHGDTALSGEVINAAMEVHTCLGPGLLESAYRSSLVHELRLRGHEVRVEVPLPVTYKAMPLDVAYRMDLVVERALLVEIKTVTRVHPVHHAQLLSYLKLSGLRVGLLINFHAYSLRDGLKRMVAG